MKKWEYLVQNLSIGELNVLQYAGREGWELVSVVVNYDVPKAYFKRPITEPKETE